MGRFDEAIAEVRHAQALDPLDSVICGVLGELLLAAHRDEEAIASLKRTLELEPDSVRAHLSLAKAYRLSGRLDLAMEESRRLVELGHPGAQFSMALDHAAAGRTAQALDVLNALIPRASQLPLGPFLIANTYAVLGDEDQAFSWLEAAFKQHDGILVHLKTFREFESLRADPRFQDLVRRIGIPEH